jgi:hypothetical protein
MKIEHIPAKIHKDAICVRLIYGSYKIRSSIDTKSLRNTISIDLYNSSYSFMIEDDFLCDMIVLKALSILVNKMFQKAIIGDGLYNHYNLFADLSRTPKT